jgi:hypothetical protein
MKLTLRALKFSSMMLAAGTLAACGGGHHDSGNPPASSIKGTAAVGAAMANASVTLACKSGNGSATADANGSWTATFAFDGPCAITATNGAVTLHSFAAGAGTFNVTPLTELMLSFLAGQMGTTVSGLLSGITSNPAYQSALTNSTMIASAQAAVVKLIKDTYGITLSSASFLTVSFTPGTAGADSDLDTLLAAGAITSNGQPAATLTSAATAAGAAAASGNGTTTPPADNATGGVGGSTGV